jgi:hypothetical protein
MLEALHSYEDYIFCNNWDLCWETMKLRKIGLQVAGGNSELHFPYK